MTLKQSICRKLDAQPHFKLIGYAVRYMETKNRLPQNILRKIEKTTYCNFSQQKQVHVFKEVLYDDDNYINE